MVLQTRHLSKGTAVQISNEMSVEYDFSEPSFVIKSLRKHQELPPFQAINLWYFKNKITFICIGILAPQKKLAKKNVAPKILEMLFTRFIFLEDIPKQNLARHKNFKNQWYQQQRNSKKNKWSHV